MHVFHRHGARLPNFADFKDEIEWNDCVEEFKDVEVDKSNPAIAYIRPNMDAFPEKSQLKKCQYWQLTLKGHRQLRELGLALKDVYSSNAEMPWFDEKQGLIGPSDVHIRSTDVM